MIIMVIITVKQETVEPLYKGQVGDRSFIPYTVEPLYKGQVGDGYYIVESLYKGQVGDGSFIPCREAVLFSEVTNVLSPWEVGRWLSSSQR